MTCEVRGRRYLTTCLENPAQEFESETKGRQAWPGHVGVLIPQLVLYYLLVLYTLHTVQARRRVASHSEYPPIIRSIEKALFLLLAEEGLRWICSS